MRTVLSDKYHTTSLGRSPVHSHSNHFQALRRSVPSLRAQHNKAKTPYKHSRRHHSRTFVQPGKLCAIALLREVGLKWVFILLRPFLESCQCFFFQSCENTLRQQSVERYNRAQRKDLAFKNRAMVNQYCIDSYQ